MKTPAITRADKEGSAAASDLGNRFIIYGEKGDITNVAPTAGNFVFPNYQVNWVNSSANTTSSNSKGWEYVGYTHSENYQNNITRDPSSAADDEVKASNSAQTIKYWDYNANNYIFTAVSADDDDIDKGRVKIQKNEYGATAYDKGYTITLAKSGDADSYKYPTLNKLYFSDRNVIAKSEGTDRNATNAYGGNVTMKFRNLVSHIRAGIYERIPGYDITSMTFYISDGDDAGDELDATAASTFGAICKNSKANDFEGTLKVEYYGTSDSGPENQPKVTVSSSSTTKDDLILGSNFNLSTSKKLGEDAAHPTWDTDGGTFTEVLPQITNDANLKLTVDYTLWNSVTQETIEIKGSTAEIPSQYLQWKPNYQYTYLFKITDGALYPITFDAVEIIAEDGNVEYITTVSEPSITTYSKASAVTANNEYKTKNNIYVAVEDGSTNPALAVTGADINAKLYFVTLAESTDDGDTPAATASQSITEISVANAITNGTKDNDLAPTTWTVKDANKWKLTVKDISSTLTGELTSIPADDSPSGVTLSINVAKFRPTPSYQKIEENALLTKDKTYYTSNSEDAVSFVAAEGAKADASTYEMTATGAGDYAFEYTKAAVNATYEIITSGTTITAGTKYYTESSGVYTEDTAESDFSADGSQYRQTSPYKPATKYYKIIKVVE